MKIICNPIASAQSASCEYEDNRGASVIAIIKGPREFLRSVHYDGLNIQVFIENTRVAPPLLQSTYKAYELLIKETLKQVVDLEKYPSQQLHVILEIQSDPQDMVPLSTFINAASIALTLHGMQSESLLISAEDGKDGSTIASTAPECKTINLYRTAQNGADIDATTAEQYCSNELMKLREFYDKEIAPVFAARAQRSKTLRRVFL